MTSHTDKIIINDATIITLLNWLDEDGFPNFSFYAITGENLENFSRALKSGRADLEKYGYVIRHGYGHPKDSDWGFMKDKYGIEKDKIVVAELPK